MNKMAKTFALAAASAALTAGIFGPAVHAQTVNAVKAGFLTCDAAKGWSLVVSVRDLKCTYTPASGTPEHYTGHIDNFGVVGGYSGGGIIAWAVLAPSANPGKGALAGKYGGASAGGAFAVGGGVNVLVGGSNKTISLQPLSVEGNTGLNLAVGVTELTLKPATE